ncbi:MAG: CDP-2,3-bis-(O-geranylgeranyl)-sn-glycerol synthase [Candidatus Bathyarchaeota archaeon]|nr:MAG: CDP-2,3-bis-(O-geranylgeranyl)-sn-glycerol synthase [Candidatus Bathyarchaeota archaeon]
MSIVLLATINALYFIFPAYCANAAPVIFGGGTPIDIGRKFLDRKPILGSHKTFRGFFAGLIIGSSVGFVQHVLFQSSSFLQDTLWFQSSVSLGFILSLGALVGDLIGSFFKRRLGLSPGASLPMADQLDFVVTALLFSLLVSPPPLPAVLIIVVITPPMHFLSNLVGRLLRKKNISC